VTGTDSVACVKRYFLLVLHIATQCVQGRIKFKYWCLCCWPEKGLLVFYSRHSRHTDTEKNFSSIFMNWPNAEASIAPTLIRHCMCVICIVFDIYPAGIGLKSRIFRVKAATEFAMMFRERKVEL